MHSASIMVGHIPSKSVKPSCHLILSACNVSTMDFRYVHEAQGSLRQKPPSASTLISPLRILAIMTLVG